MYLDDALRSDLISDMIWSRFDPYSFFSGSLDPREFLFSCEYEYRFISQCIHRYPVSVWDISHFDHRICSDNYLEKPKRRTADCNSSRWDISRTQCVRGGTYSNVDSTVAYP